MGGENTIRIFKKSAPNGQVYIYMGKREYVSVDGCPEPIQGVVYIKDFKNTMGRVFVQLVITFRHGDEDDGAMGHCFKKELILDRTQVYPPDLVEMVFANEKTTGDQTKLQTRLIQKLGEGAFPFTVDFPDLAPNSVLICSEDSQDPAKRRMGVFYDVRVHLAEAQDDFVGKKASTVTMGIRKAQFAPIDIKSRSPTSVAEKGFMFSSGKVVVEASLEKEVYYHGEELPVKISINNQSKKTVKNIRCNISQHCELTMIDQQYSCKVARLESQDGCPLQPGSSMTRTIIMKPLAQSCQGLRGLCLDAALSKVTDEANLASSSLVENGCANDLLGVIVSYSVKVNLMLSGLGGELETDLPFKLVHPRQGTLESQRLDTEKRAAREKGEARRKKFYCQDSVLNETFDNNEDQQG